MLDSESQATAKRIAHYGSEARPLTRLERYRERRNTRLITREPSMQIPRFWEKQTVEGVDARGNQVSAGGWGWSATSVDEARSRARASARRVLNWLIGGDSAGQPPDHYGYDERLPREEIIDEYNDESGAPHAFISRNAYGALILNTRDLMFIDIDLPPQPPPSPWGLIAKWFGKREQVQADPAEAATAKIRTTASRFGDLGFRVYRTLNGFRVLVANQPMLPDSPRSQELLAAFDTDPLYVRMCKNQQCFRARLTPKAWRCKIPMPPSRYPFTKPGSEAEYRRWEQIYSDKTRSFSTCKLIDVIGPDVIDAGVAGLVEIHDQLTKANVTQPLA